MDDDQTTYNFQLPREVLDKLREQSKKLGVSVSALVKIAISKAYSKEVSKMGSET